jgi:hypothetical protein
VASDGTSGLVDESSTRMLPMLTILVATCETTLNTLKAADNPVDDELTGLLEKMVERTHVEIERLKAAL